MAVTYDTVGPSSAGTAVNGTSLTWSHTCSGSDRLLTVGVALGANPDTGITTTATYNSVSMTSAGKIHSNNSTTGYVELFYLVAPATGSNTVAVTCSATKDITSGSVSFNGVDQTTPVSNITTAAGTGTPTINVSSANGNMVVDALANGSNINSSNQDMRWRKNFNTSTAAGNGAQSTAPGSSTTTITYSVVSDWWAMVGMNVNAVAAAPSVATVGWISA